MPRSAGAQCAVARSMRHRFMQQCPSCRQCLSLHESNAAHHCSVHATVPSMLPMLALNGRRAWYRNIDPRDERLVAPGCCAAHHHLAARPLNALTFHLPGPPKSNPRPTHRLTFRAEWGLPRLLGAAHDALRATHGCRVLPDGEAGSAYRAAEPRCNGRRAGAQHRRDCGAHHLHPGLDGSERGPWLRKHRSVAIAATGRQDAEEAPAAPPPAKGAGVLLTARRDTVPCC